MVVEREGDKGFGWWERKGWGLGEVGEGGWERWGGKGRELAEEVEGKDRGLGA